MSKRNTIQQSLVLEAVQKLHCHATAEQIFQQASAAHPTISRATVYRNLRELDSAGKVKRIEVPSGPDHFDYDVSMHYHMRCTHCGRIFDIKLKSDPRLTELVDDDGFAIEGCDVMFRGICPECRHILALKDGEQKSDS